MKKKDNDIKNWILLLGVLVVIGMVYQEQAKKPTTQHLFSLFSGSSVVEGTVEFLIDPIHLAEPQIMVAILIAGIFVYTAYRGGNK